MSPGHEEEDRQREQFMNKRIVIGGLKTPSRVWHERR